MSRTGQQECVLEVPAFKSQCPIGFALNGGECDYQPLDSGIWQVGYCKSFSSNEVPTEWISNGVCATNPVPGPFVQNPVSGSCPSNWVNTMLLTGQQQCVLVLPSFKGNSCPIGFILHDSRCEYVPQNSGGWQVGFCKSFSSDEIPPEWISNQVCDVEDEVWLRKLETHLSLLKRQGLISLWHDRLIVAQGFGVYPMVLKD
jgi:hypothetical protein